MKKICALVLVLITGLLSNHPVNASPEGMQHEMQHGFIIPESDSFFGHLVASGHHSHQLSFSGILSINDPEARDFYESRRKINTSQKTSYFLFQAQKLNLPQTASGQVLVGHIVECPIGGYTPQNIVVREAKIEVGEIFINVINPFFRN